MSYIPIVCTIDSGNALQAATLFRGIIRNTKRDLKFYVYHDSVEIKLQRQLEKEFDKLNIEWIEINVPESMRPSRRHYTKTAYARIFVPKSINENRFIYLDVDLTVRVDIAQLWDIDMEGHPVAGVSEGKKYGFHNPYLNSGVLIIDTIKWNLLGLTEKALEYCQGRDLYDDDQEILNTLLPAYRLLDPKWNRQRYLPESVVPYSDSYIYHFNGPLKPWVPFADFILSRFALLEWRRNGGRTEWSYSSLRLLMVFILGNFRLKVRSIINKPK